MKTFISPSLVTWHLHYILHFAYYMDHIIISCRSSKCGAHGFWIRCRGFGKVEDLVHRAPYKSIMQTGATGWNRKTTGHICIFGHTWWTGLPVAQKKKKKNPNKEKTTLQRCKRWEKQECTYRLQSAACYPGAERRKQWRESVSSTVSPLWAIWSN